MTKLDSIDWNVKKEEERKKDQLKDERLPMYVPERKLVAQST